MAIWSRDGNASEAALSDGLSQLTHRGPDGRGVWIASHRQVALGHTRLSIIDLDGGAQPIANEDERIHVVVNGELYQHDEIRAELEARGHQLRTRSDSEIVVHLYEELGVHCLRRLRGEFAFVLWDDRSQTLFAARDRFGIKPLYYAWVGDVLYLASEAKALFAAGVAAAWDHESVYRLYQHGWFDNDRSMFAGVRQVPPGHFLLATRGGVRVSRYWDLDYPRDAPREDGTEVEAVRDAFEEAVRIRLRADVPVGCYLSGGIDSCAVLGAMARHASGPIDAYTVCFDEPAYSEEAAARDMASHVGAQFHPLVVSEAQLAQHFSDAIWNAEILAVNAHGVAKYLLSRLVRDRGRKVVLVGEGSDEVFGGYVHFRRDVALQAIEDGSPGAADALERLARRNPAWRKLLDPRQAANGSADDGGAVFRRVLGFTPTAFEPRPFHAAKRELLDASFTSPFASRDMLAAALDSIDVEGQLAGRARAHQSMYLWTKGFLATYILNTLGDRVEMANSVEGRVPFLDHVLVERVVKMPMSVKIRGTELEEKWVLRQAARPLVTPAAFERQKQAFVAPPLRVGGPFHERLQDMCRSQSMMSVPFFDRRKVIALLDRLPTLEAAAREMWNPILFSILSAGCLQERFHPGAGN